MLCVSTIFSFNVKLLKWGMVIGVLLTQIHFVYREYWRCHLIYEFCIKEERKTLSYCINKRRYHEHDIHMYSRSKNKRQIWVFFNKFAWSDKCTITTTIFVLRDVRQLAEKWMLDLKATTVTASLHYVNNIEEIFEKCGSFTKQFKEELWSVKDIEELIDWWTRFICFCCFILPTMH